MAKRVLVNGYFVGNFGDDLFLKILVERYPKCKFYIVANKKLYCEFRRYRNLKIINTSNKYYNFRFQQHLKRGSDYNEIVKHNLYRICDIAVMIGGSLFMEDKVKLDTLCRQYNQVQYYILGVNVGPIFTEEYMTKVKNIFKNSKDVCVRDKASFAMVKDVKQVRYAPDIVFNLKRILPAMEKKKVVISLINPYIRNFTDSQISFYQKQIQEMIEDYKQKDYEIVLLSFCSKEKDYEYGEEILEKYTFCRLLKYENNMETILSELQESEIIIATRYHAMILGFLMKKKVIPISYSNKMKNVLDDLKFPYSYVDLLQEEKIASRKNVEYEVLDVTDMIKDAAIQFEKLDEVLGNCETR